MTLILFCIAFCAGAALSAQSAINSQLSTGLGGMPVVASLVSVAGSTILLSIFTLTRGELTTALILPDQPWWRLTGGLLGAGIMLAMVLLTSRIGLANLLVLFIGGQLLFSMTIDNFGLFGLDVRHVSPIKLGGAAVMIAGVLLTLFGDRLFGASPP